MKQFIIRMSEEDEYFEHWQSHIRHLAKMHNWKLEELDV